MRYGVDMQMVHLMWWLKLIVMMLWRLRQKLTVINNSQVHTSTWTCEAVCLQWMSKTFLYGNWIDASLAGTFRLETVLLLFIKLSLKLTSGDVLSYWEFTVFCHRTFCMFVYNVLICYQFCVSWYTDFDFSLTSACISKFIFSLSVASKNWDVPLTSRVTLTIVLHYRADCDVSFWRTTKLFIGRNDFCLYEEIGHGEVKFEVELYTASSLMAVSAHAH